MVAWCHGNLHRNTTASSKNSSCRGWDGSSPLLQKKVGWCVSSVAEGEESWGALALKRERGWLTVNRARAAGMETGSLRSGGVRGVLGVSCGERGEEERAGAPRSFVGGEGAAATDWRRRAVPLRSGRSAVILEGRRRREREGDGRRGQVTSTRQLLDETTSTG